MLYECICCGLRFTRPRRFREARGECFGFPAYETLSGCPRCGGAFTEADTERRPEK